MPVARVSIKAPSAAGLRRHILGRVQQARSKISTAVAELWRSKLITTHLSPEQRRRYSDAITPYRAPEVGAYISDFLAKIFEKGHKKFDMKPGLLAGRTRRVIPIEAGGETKFRTVTINSPEDSWIHPAFRGAKLAWRVRRSLRRLVREAMRDV